MQNNFHFYKMPLDLSRLMEGKSLPTCSLGESISQQIFMLITTRYGELKSAPDFGCSIWDLEFERFHNYAKWEEQVKESLTSGIAKYETRLKDTTVHISLSDVEVVYPFRTVSYTHLTLPTTYSV